VGIERDHRSVAEAVAHDQVGRALHAGGFDHRLRHRVRLDRQPELFEQLLHTRRVGGAVAGRVVARHLDELGKERGLARKIALDEGGDLVGKRGHLDALFARHARRGPCNARQASVILRRPGQEQKGPRSWSSCSPSG
jgi:hypothetical protein